jgi:hypothetical protein
LRERVDGSPPHRELSQQDRLIQEATKELGASKKGKERENRKRRRLPGEDDTDRDIRFAKEREEQRLSSTAVARLRSTKDDEADAPLTDSKGHINLFPEAKPSSDRMRRSEVDRTKQQQRGTEENLGMPLTDALGGSRDPRGAWYLDKDGSVKDSTGRDVWGNEDPRRRQRDVQRMGTTDPLAFMKRAQTQLKDARREREEWQQRMIKESRAAGADDDLEDFSLDGPAAAGDSRSSHGRHDESRRHRHDRKHSRDRRRRGDDEPRRRRARSRSRDREGPSDDGSRRRRNRNPA